MSIFNKVTKTFQWGQHTVTLETGEIARQSSGAVVVSIEDTVVLATVVARKDAKPGQDFFPLTVDYIEKTYAAGKIPGSFFKREGRPSELETLTSRLIDRPLRPLFPDGFYNEVQVVIHVLSLNPEIAADVPALIGASAALAISGIPFNGPIGAVRMAHHDGQWIAHPTYEQGAESTFQLVVAGRRTESGDIAVMMVEAGGTERSWELYEDGAPKVTESVIAEGLEASKEWIGKAIDLQQELVAAVVLAHGEIEQKPFEKRVDYQDDVFEAVTAQAKPNTAEAMAIADKTERNDRLDEILEGLLLALTSTPAEVG
ncbi:MAG: polyribonucleotide nucleotidyltransferase, partial [Rhizobacter sp.]|nr:polyribonucleotide nucleotidyltransferase [Rhizobacter sp.]